MSAPPISERHLPHFHRRGPIVESVRFALTSNVDLATACEAGDSQEGLTLVAGDRFGAFGQSTGSQNGIYVVQASGAAIRAYDLSTDDPNFGFLVYVREGTSNSRKVFKSTNTSAPTVGTTALTFEEFADATAHIGDATDAHDASAISYIPTGPITATEVQGAFTDTLNWISDHLTDATAAHDASAVDYDNSTSGLTATDAQAAIDELAASGSGPLSNYTATTDPTVNDDSGDGYSEGSRWINTSTDEEFVCTDDSVGAAVWVSTTDTGGGGGSDLVQVASGAGSVRIPGILVPDRVPGSPHASDEEFDSTSLASLTAIGSLAASDADTTAASHLYLESTGTTLRIDGYYKSIPSMPFTVTTKITGWARPTNQGLGAKGLFIGAAGGAGKCMTMEMYGSNPGFLERLDYTNPTTYAGTNTNIVYAIRSPLYLRMIVTSSTDVTSQWSDDGVIWHTLAANTNPGFTIGIVGLFVNSSSSVGHGKAIFDFIRFT